MSRKYTSWALNKSPINSDSKVIRLATVAGNEENQFRNSERVEATPHTYINVDAPPPSLSIVRKMDNNHLVQPTIISKYRQSSFAPPTMVPTTANIQTKLWPTEKQLKSSSLTDSSSSTSKKTHKHKHHHHNHRHHHHRHHHHNRRNRAKSIESFRQPSKVVLSNSQYIEQDQQQPMIVYREVPNGDGYTIDANVPYTIDNDASYVDDQQSPIIVYRDANIQQAQPSLMTDQISQPVFFNQDQDTTIGKQNTCLKTVDKNIVSHRVASLNETQVGNCSSLSCSQNCVAASAQPCATIGYVQEIERIYIEEDVCSCSQTNPDCTSRSYIFQQHDPRVCLPSVQQQTPQLVYCAEPAQQDILCTSANNHIIQQTISPQQQYVCVDNPQQTVQSIVNVPQSQLSRATSVIIPQSQPIQILQQPQVQPVQVIQQPQPIQIIQNPQAQSGQLIQIAPNTQQLIQASPVLQTIQAMPTQTVTASPQILYQRPYDPVLVPVQNQQIAVANQPLVTLSQPSYAPSRVVPATLATQSQGPNMFRHALLRTVSDRTGLPVVAPSSNAANIQGLSTAAVPSALVAGNVNRSASLPIVPLTPGGLLIPFQPSKQTGLKAGPLPRTGGYPSTLRNFNDIREQIQQQREELTQRLKQQTYNRAPSPPVFRATNLATSTPYRPAGSIAGTVPMSGGSYAPSLLPSTYMKQGSIVPTYSQPSLLGSSVGSGLSGPTTPYRSFNS